MSNINKELKWISCDGGPHILMEKKCMKLWEGSEVPLNGRIVNSKSKWNQETFISTDYDLACDINDYIGIIEVQNGSAIVINDDVPISTFITDKNGIGNIVVLNSWENGNYSEELYEIICALNLNDFEDSGIIYRTSEPQLYHFPACDIPTKPVYDFIEISLQPGTYRIYRKDSMILENGEIRVFRFHKE